MDIETEPPAPFRDGHGLLGGMQRSTKTPNLLSTKMQPLPQHQSHVQIPANASKARPAKTPVTPPQAPEEGDTSLAALEGAERGTETKGWTLVEVEVGADRVTTTKKKER